MLYLHNDTPQILKNKNRKTVNRILWVILSPEIHPKQNGSSLFPHLAAIAAGPTKPLTGQVLHACYREKMVSGLIYLKKDHFLLPGSRYFTKIKVFMLPCIVAFRFPARGKRSGVLRKIFKCTNPAAWDSDGNYYTVIYWPDWTARSDRQNLPTQACAIPAFKWKAESDCRPTRFERYYFLNNCCLMTTGCP